MDSEREQNAAQTPTQGPTLSRWDRYIAPATEAEPMPAVRPSGRVTWSIVVLSLILIGVLLYGFGSGSLKLPAFSPSPAQGRAPRAVAVDACIESAREYLGRGEHAKAAAILRQATAECADNQPLRLAYAEVLLAQKKFAEAYDQYVKALAIGPREHTVEFAAGTVASLAGLSERAVEHYSAAQVGDPNNPAYPLYLGQVQLRLGHTASGKANLLRAANLDETNAEAWGTLADIAIRENNVNIALQHIARARTLQPDRALWRVIEAKALNRTREPEKALTVLLAMDPSQRRDLPTLRVIAESYGLLDRPGDGAASFAGAADAQPKDRDLPYEAALWFDRAGYRAKALEYARRAQANGNEAGAKLVEKLAEK